MQRQFWKKGAIVRLPDLKISQYKYIVWWVFSPLTFQISLSQKKNKMNSHNDAYIKCPMK